ncbi:MAG TPA: SRPBCC family protein [Candidatus Saccharimonadales bacterium]|nr:SRPBCC family protein [Candidatus Saccharimonadales bacterium]
MKIVVDIDIKAPVENVYKIFSDIKNAEKNIKNIQKIEILKSTKDFVGTRWKETRTEFGKSDTIEMWVSDAKSNKFYEVESEAHGTKYLSRYDFESTKQSTKVTLTFEGQPQTLGAKLMSVMMVFFAGATKKLFLKDMLDLKKILEN